MSENEEPRTKQQNKAIHVYFAKVAEALNAADKPMIVQVGAKITKRLWTAERVKEYIWRPLQLAECGTLSTTELKTTEPSVIYDHVNAFIGEQFGIHVPFPDRFNQALEMSSKSRENAA